jgi:outer membrane beta-barrel protein
MRGGATPAGSRVGGWWIATACALALAPSSDAWAQKKGGGKKKPPAAAAPAAAPPASDEIELDESPPAAATEPAAAPDAPATPGGGICEIDPSACPKEADIAEASKRPIQAEVYAVQQIYALRRNRFEIAPYFAVTLNDQFVSHPGPGLAVNYYLTNVLAVGLNGTYYEAFNNESDFNFQNRRAARIAVPLTEYAWNANINFSYVPIYGKFAGFGDFIFHYDTYLIGGVGAISTRPIPVIDPDNRSFEYDVKVAFNVGLGLRIFFNRWLALNLELRDYMFVDRLESLTIPPTQEEQQNKATWFGEDSFTNNVQAQMGLTFFLPTSWEYRLPK